MGVLVSVRIRYVAKAVLAFINFAKAFNRVYLYLSKVQVQAVELNCNSVVGFVSRIVEAYLFNHKATGAEQNGIAVLGTDTEYTTRRCKATRRSTLINHHYLVHIIVTTV